MKIIYAEGQQRSGSLGATTASFNRFGAYLRPRTTPVNPNTARQSDVRNEFKALSIAWDQTLTQAQRDQWDVYASNVAWVDRMGLPVTLTGMNHFVRSGTSRKQVGLLALAAAPAVFDLAPAELSPSGNASEASQNITYNFDDTAEWLDLDDAYQAVYIGIPQNGSRKFFNGPWRFADVILGDSAVPPTTPATIASPYPIQEGQRVWLQTRIGLDDGRLSTFARTDFPITA